VAVRDAWAAVAMEVVTGTPESLAASLKTDMAHWKPVVRASGFTAEEQACSSPGCDRLGRRQGSSIAAQWR
jgi:hypothetical protein